MITFGIWHGHLRLRVCRTPGLALARNGYIPVGSCLRGNGDHDCIRSPDGATGPLFRIDHDAVDEVGYDSNDAIAPVVRYDE